VRISVGEAVQYREQPVRVISTQTIFGETYLDIFIEPAGPIRRVLLKDVEQRPSPLHALTQPTAAHPARFAAQTIAYQLQALVAQPGISSAGSFRITPLPHQILAVDFILNRLPHGPRCLVAEEVGLGKTIEAALVYQELKLRGQARRVLVVAPSGLTAQWRDEMQQKFDEAFVIYDREMVATLTQIHGQAANVWQAHDRVITSLDFVKPRPIRPDLSAKERARRQAHNEQRFEALLAADWDMVIFDEAHKLSKHGDGTETARFKVGAALAPHAPVLLLLTATPHQGDPGRFHHLLQLLDEHRFVEFSDLTPENVQQVTWRTRKRAAVDSQGNRLFKQRLTDIFPVDRSGPDHAAERELYDRVTDYVSENYNLAISRQDRAFGFLMILFQRLVTSSSQAIAQALQKRLGRLRALQTAVVTPTPLNDFDEQEAADQDAQALLDELLDSAGPLDPAALAREISILAELLDLAQRAGRTHDAKIKALLQIISEVCAREQNPATKFLIFTEFVATQTMILETLHNLGYGAVAINGGMNLEQRIQARKQFADSAQFMVSTDAGGEGINLQFCHVIVNYDLPFNPMKLEQRIGRLDRIGQTQNVLVFNLIIADTVDKRVREILEEKLKLIAEQFGEDKLADILSTLQDEFNFDRLFLDAVIKRQEESAELEVIAQKMVARAEEVITQENLLLPHSQADAGEAEARLSRVPLQQVQALVSGYLAAKGERLQEYARRPHIYYFTDEGTHVADVVFDPALAVADDALTLLHINHPLVQRIMAEYTTGETAVACLRVPHLAMPGLWAIYRLTISDANGVLRRHVLPFFLDETLTPQATAVRHLLALDPLQFQPGPMQVNLPDLAPFQNKLDELSQTAGREKFLAEQVAHNERLDRRRELLLRSFQQQERALNAIAIENIREGRRRELLRRRQTELQGLEQQRTLIPDLKLVQLAWLEER
jgi:superfamily II DNA or RNA helicase